MNTEAALEEYSFETAEMHMTLCCIIPPIYNVKVTGETGSLNPVIKLVSTGQVDNNYVVVEVQGKDGMAIGSMEYTKSIDLQEVKDTKGVVVKGANGKEVQLDWNDVSKLSDTATTGLFHLQLQSETNLMGAPILHMSLGVDSVNDKVTGIASVTQALEKPVVCTSHVTGNLIYETVMKPGVSKIRIDLSGYPEIHWPSGGGVGPVIPKNFSAMLLFDSNWTNGTVQYQYATTSGWVKESQKLIIM